MQIVCVKCHRTRTSSGRWELMPIPKGETETPAYCPRCNEEETRRIRHGVRTNEMPILRKA